MSSVSYFRRLTNNFWLKITNALPKHCKHKEWKKLCLPKLWPCLFHTCHIFHRMSFLYSLFFVRLFLTFLTEIPRPSRCTTVTSSIRYVTSWFRTIVCTEFVTVTSINIKTDTSLPEKNKYNFDYLYNYMYICFEMIIFKVSRRSTNNYFSE